MSVPGAQEELLVMEVHIKLKHVVSRQLADMLLVSLDLILNPDYLRVAAPIQFIPDFLNLPEPMLVRCMCVLVSDPTDASDR